MDSGDGTQARMIRAGLSPQALDCVLITHLHGDHILGLPALLSTMSLQGRQAPLKVFGPRGIQELLNTVLRLTDVRLSFPLFIEEIHRDWSMDMSGFSARCAPLDHRIEAFAYRLDFSPRHAGVSITYCTDTRPCEEAAQLAKNTDLLIHEATYLHELVDKASERGHSTALQAAQIALVAGARRLLLTHFSPRYTTLEKILLEARSIFPSSEVAQEGVAIDVVARESGAVEQKSFGLIR